MKKPRKPSKPLEPAKPVEPPEECEHYMNCNSSLFSFNQYYSLNDFNEIVKSYIAMTNIDEKNVRICFTISDYDDYYAIVELYESRMIVNPKYKSYPKKIKKYKDAYLKYKKDYHEYEIKLDLYEKQMEEFNKQNNSTKSDSMTNAELILKLKKEIAELESNLSSEDE